MEMRVYRAADGTEPFTRWFDDLDAVAAAKVTTALTRLGLGNTSNVKGVGSGVFELRMIATITTPFGFPDGSRRISRETHPGPSRVDVLRSIFNW